MRGETDTDYTDYGHKITAAISHVTQEKFYVTFFLAMMAVLELNGRHRHN